MTKTRLSSLISLGIAGSVVVLLWFYKVVLLPRPYWIMSGGDGEVAYFFNSLAMLHGHRPPSAFHPGTPLMCAGAILAKILHAGPETMQTFLFYGYLIGLLATCAAVGGILFLMMPGSPVWLGVPIALSYFLFPSAPFYLTQWGCYLFHLPLVVLILWTLHLALNNARQGNPLTITLAGFTVGMACAVHLIFFPFIPAGLIALTAAVFLTKKIGPAPSARTHRIGASAVSLFGVGLSIGTILFMARLQSQGHSYTALGLLFACLKISLLIALADLWLSWTTGWNRTNSWLSAAAANFKFIAGATYGWLLGSFLILDRLITRYHGGRLYGTSGYDVSWVTIDNNIRVLIQGAPVWCAVVFLTLTLITFLLLRTLFQPADKRVLSPAKIGLGFALVTFSILNIALSIHQGGYFKLKEQVVGLCLRYFLPSAATITCGLAWLAQGAFAASTQNRRMLKLLSLILIGASFFQIAQDIVRHHEDVQQGYAQKKAVDEKLEEFTRQAGRKPYILMGNLQRPSFALRWGSAVSDFLFNSEIDRFYPYEREIPSRAASAAVPRDGRQADLIVIRKPELSYFKDEQGQLKDWFRQIMGPVEPLEEGLSDPLLVIHVRHKELLHD